MIIVILGPQGSGKGTQARKISEKHNLFYLDAGALLRKIAKTDSRIDEIVNKRGQLLDDGEMYTIVTKHLEEFNKTDNIIFDGYPRSVKQFEMINKWIVQKGATLDFVIFLDISDDEAVKRLSARRTHKKTGVVYNMITNPPPEGTPKQDLEHREDDKPEAIKERLNAYHTTTQPLIKFLQEKYPSIVHKVNGEDSIENIEKTIEGIISPKNGQDND